MGPPLVLCYHALSERWPAVLSVAPGDFESRLESLARRGYRGITFHQAVHASPGGRAVAITFDDAFRSVWELARPVLARLGWPGTVFAPTAFIGSEAPMAWPGIEHWIGGPHEPELVPMSWEELGELADAGWEVGSHSRTHARLPELGDEELADELSGSRRECEERLGAPCRSVAYPYGAEDERVLAAARRAGYEAGAALSRRTRPVTALRRARVGVYRGDGAWRFRLKASPAVRALRAAW